MQQVQALDRQAQTQEGLRLDINAPNPKAPSMTMALDDFLKEHNKNFR